MAVPAMYDHDQNEGITMRYIIFMLIIAGSLITYEPGSATADDTSNHCITTAEATD